MLDWLSARIQSTAIQRTAIRCNRHHRGAPTALRGLLGSLRERSGARSHARSWSDGEFHLPAGRLAPAVARRGPASRPRR